MNFASKFKPSFTLRSALQKQSDIKMKGFTLIEVLVVIAILGVLSSAVLIAINPAVRGGQARDAVRKQDLGVVYNALVAYLVDHGTLPYAGTDFAAGSSEEFWLTELENDYLKKIPKDPRQAGLIGNLARSFDGLSDRLSFFKDKNRGEVAAVTVPDKSKTYQMKVLVLNYMPTSGSNLNSTITGISSSVTAMRSNVNNIKNETMQALEDGSKYHGTGSLAMDYSILAEKEYLEALPIGLPLKPGVFRPDYIQVLNRENICDLVDNQGLKEVWLFGYHYGNIEPVESNMAGPYGDVSNSEGTNDMPICTKTYVLYNYNYGRSSDAATHNHGHHIEVVLKHFGDPMFENKFIGPFSTYGSNDGTGANYHRCGWTHTPPNTSGGYDYTNTRYSWTDCEDWKPDGSGNKVNINCTRWQCIERKYHSWRWQGMPGKDNNVLGATNWWDFIGDFDAAKASGQKLVYDLTPPSIPTGLAASNIFSNRLTITWGASTDDYQVAGYEIKRGGVVVGSTSTTSFVDYTVSAGTAYQYTVAAQDTSGNMSAESSVLDVATSSSQAGDPTRPVLDSTSYKVGGPSAKNYSFFHSIGNGPNRYLVVGIGMRHGNSNSAVSVKFKGTDLLKIGVRDSGGLRTELWGLKNPSIGLGEVVVDLAKQPSGGATMAGATSWAYVDQTTPTGAYAGASGFSNNPSLIVPSTANSVVVDVAAMPSNGWTGTAGSGQTVVWNQYSAGDTTTMGSYRDGTAWISGMSWNTNNEAWSISGVSINLGLPPPIIIIPDPSPTSSPISSPASSTSPTASPEPQAEVGCPQSIGNYCYVASADLKSFTLWAWLENDVDNQIWNKPGATCSLTPPNPQYYNFCMKY